jgi:hypothetical protein
MHAAAILVILFSHQGYWFGGQDQTVTVTWPLDQKMPAADLRWELNLGELRLSGDQIRVPGEQGPTAITLKVPKVRVRTEMRWTFRLTAADGGKELLSGERSVHVFPPTSWGDLAARPAKQKFFVVDQPDGLPSLLAAAKIDFARLETVEALQSVKADVVIVGANQLGDSLFAQSPLVSQAKSGAQIMVLEQRQAKTLISYALGPRPVPSNFSWREEHPLFAGLDEHDLASWVDGGRNDLYAVHLPRDEAALEVAYWPRESPGCEPVPIDALVAVKAIGKGRMVLWQIPLDDWKRDPRSQLLLENALNYLMTRPEPTPRPSERPATMPAATIAVPTITIP